MPKTARNKPEPLYQRLTRELDAWKPEDDDRDPNNKLTPSELREWNELAQGYGAAAAGVPARKRWGTTRS